MNDLNFVLAPFLPQINKTELRNEERICINADLSALTYYKSCHAELKKTFLFPIFSEKLGN